LRERSLGADHPDVADVLDRLARVYTLTERYDDAVKTVRRALEIKEHTLSAPDDVRIARSLEAQAFTLQPKGDYASARLAIDRAVAIRNRHNANHPEMAGALNLLAEQLSLEGNIVQAREVATKAVALADHTLRPDHPNIGAYLRTLAVAVSALG